MSKKRRPSNELNAGSMADIAFLLLIFFLVTTTIDIDKGILVRLPPYVEIPPPPDQLNKNNVLTVKVNGKDELLVEQERFSLANLRAYTKDFISNPTQRQDRPDKPSKAIISLQNDRQTSYNLYLQVYNELQGAYRELREEHSQLLYNTSYTSLNQAQQTEIRRAIPLVISEAEPTEYN